ncbi:alpha/beta-hydrolase [Hypoxylon fragiforme]|uniref:alpha/beta-hydrolase n=1 Tax=Hypoxylon fragiforme TaxID=63214 RepID=UPI0020C5F8A9|nr:alpha/beta-hydrolase [Hypoxylon fragiforme]KAI2611595.1 alpha/beta-hydrolase [Hypoxylon fragiforme]
MRFELALASIIGMTGVMGVDPGSIGMGDALTTANMPEEFLDDVYFVEHVPLMALQVDPRISYALYVPTTHYTADPAKSGGPKLPLLVYVHGTGRNTVAIFDELVPFSNSTPCAIVAPVFPMGLDGPNDLDSYKQINGKTLRSDNALLSVLDQVSVRWPGIETSKVFMMGFSGGGQFAHRFLYLHPDRLAGISVGSPGRPTFLDNTQDWPVGTKDVQAVFGKAIDTAAIAKLPIQLVVGNKDTEIHGDEAFWEWKKETFGDGGLPPMNETRVESIEKLRDSWSAAGIQTQFNVVDGVAHQETGVRSTVLGFLGPLIAKGI